MATKAIQRVDPSVGRWLKDFQSVGYLNLTWKEFNEIIRPDANVYPGGNFDKLELDEIMKSKVIIRRQYNATR